MNFAWHVLGHCSNGDFSAAWDFKFLTVFDDIAKFTPFHLDKNGSGKSGNNSFASVVGVENCGTAGFYDKDHFLEGKMNAVAT